MSAPDQDVQALPRATGKSPSHGKVLDVRRVDASSVTAIRVDYDRDYSVAGEWHSRDVHFFNLSFAARSSGTVGCFGGMSGKQERLGKVFYAPAGHAFSGAGSSARQQTLWVFIRTDATLHGDERFGGDLTPVLRKCLDLDSPAVRQPLLRIGQELDEPGFASALLLEGLGLLALAEAARVLRSLGDHTPRAGGLSPWRLRMIEERVRLGEGQSTLAELADLCGLSRRHLMRAFREETGRTLGNFVQETTIDRAKSLLRDTDQPIGTIATDVGFTSLAAFSTAFRRASGQTPSMFRAERRSPRPMPTSRPVPSRRLFER